MKIDIDGNEKQIIEQKRFLLKSNRHFTVGAVLMKIKNTLEKLKG